MSASLTDNTYDEVPYPSGPFHLSHPCHMATVATLFGLEAPPVRACRVLELGCASGGNLIPMALDLPGSEFIGVDLSSRQIADGNRFLEQLQADNIKLRHCSITDVDDSFGAFDYIICHGVYSWVPREVQNRILEVARDHLTPGGVMYVSYNTYPGWYLRGVVRDMMRYHAAAFEDPHDKIGQSRALLNFLVESASTHSETYRTLLKDEAEILKSQTDSYLFHEHLEDVNEPLYFFEFMARAEQSNLRYLGDSTFGTMLAEQFQEETAAILRDAPLLRQQQYMDFLTARTFRMTLLCHARLIPDRNVSPTRLLSLHVRLCEKFEETDETNEGMSDLETQFRSANRSVATSNALVKAAVRQLIQAWPSFVPIRQLLSDARRQTHDAEPGDEYTLLDDLMTFLGGEIIQASVDPPTIVPRPGSRPRSSLLARRMAELGSIVTNRAHRSVAIDDLGRFVLTRLDGKHDRDGLTDQLQEAISSGDFEVRHEDKVIESVDRTTCGEILDHVLNGLAEHSLLVESEED